jgi:hypothetical protein
MPNGWAASAGGFPAMTEHVAFLMKDIVLFSVSFYLLRQDLARVLLVSRQNHDTGAWVPSRQKHDNQINLHSGRLTMTSVEQRGGNHVATRTV